MKTVNQSKSAQYTLLYLQVEVHRVEKENTTRSTTESVSHASGGKKSTNPGTLLLEKYVYVW